MTARFRRGHVNGLRRVRGAGVGPRGGEHAAEIVIMAPLHSGNGWTRGPRTPNDRKVDVAIDVSMEPGMDALE